MKQRGVALIIVLLIVAIVAVLATEMAGRLQLHLVRSTNIKDNNQAYWYAMGAEQYAKKTISQLIQQKDPIDSTQPWAQEDITFPMPNGGIQATLEDLRACFNLNGLFRDQGNNQKTDEIRAFRNLLGQEDNFNIPSYNADIIRDALVDWLDEDSIPFGSYGAEDPEYESLVPPYIAANGLMTNKSELRLVKGIEPKWLPDLLPLLCVIPNETELKINVNTLTPEKAPLLAGLTGMSIADAENVISNIPYEDISSFLSDSAIAAAGLTAEQQKWFVTETEYFILHVKSSYNDATFSMSTKFRVENESVSVIGREFGGKL
ncbi:MAG: type II secretion system minor pseudopilin GspK [Aestuariibacter sp.]